MKLYLHTGTNKTGSSFCQTVLANNRPYLLKAGFYFPTGDMEADMLAGKISPGNGGNIAKSLVRKEKEKAIRFLNKLKTDASARNCTAILVSNEMLIRALSHPGAVSMLYEVCGTVGFQAVNLLTVLRDPVDHALSIYQHRAKGGLHSDFQKWLEGNYEAMKMYENFLPQFKGDSHNFHWVFRKYSSAPGHLMKLLFEDWLGIPAPPLPARTSVNTSLSLAELKLMQWVQKKNPDAVELLFRRFDGIEKKDKAPDSGFRKLLQQQCCQYLLNKRELIDRLNQFMPADEQLLLNSPEKLQEDAPAHFSFTETQLKAVAGALQDAGKPLFWLKNRVRGFLRFWRKLVQKKIFIKDMYNLPV